MKQFNFWLASVLLLVSALTLSVGNTAFATDVYHNFQSQLDSPAQGGFAVVPSDTVDLTIATRGIYVGVGGDVTLITIQGETLTFKSLGTGSTLSIRATRILLTGTAATDIIGLY